jgi:hypothetical protein
VRGSKRGKARYLKRRRGAVQPRTPASPRPNLQGAVSAIQRQTFYSQATFSIYLNYEVRERSAVRLRQLKPARKRNILLVNATMGLQF